jgi:alpha-mannosidase
MYHQQRWTIEKIRSRLQTIEPKIYQKSTPLDRFWYKELESPITKPDLHPDLATYIEIKPNAYWGNWQTNFLLYTTFQIPKEWGNQQPVSMYFPLGIAGDFSHPEALAYVDGLPYAAIDRHHQEFLLRPEWNDHQSHALFLHGWTGLGDIAGGDPTVKLHLGQPQLVTIHEKTRKFCSLARVASSTIEKLDQDNPVKSNLLTVLNDAFISLDTSHPLGVKFYESVDPALDILYNGCKNAGIPLDVNIHATGHAHIDVAWLWTYGQTRRKAERTFHNVVRYSEQFPDFHFSQSQPQLYQFIEEDQPALFHKIKELVSAGRWEPMGGMWVEADCNISGPESLARQFLLGRSYFKEKFGEGAETPVLWLPDVFGYAWALPQLIKQAGLKYFMTIKIGWSQYNRLPYDTFLWQGIDGTKILTHFSTVKELGSSYASTYNSMANPQEALGTWSNFQQKELHKDLLMAYGFGDGGGGPTLEMLQNLDIMGEFPGLPRVTHSSVKNFFESIEPIKTSKMMPVWNGELYLEYHRGTYTTQANMKKNNRKSEFLIHDVEFLASIADLLDVNYEYPHTEINQAWRTICLHQFHDILPGSSIGDVYKEAEEAFEILKINLNHLKQKALQAISNHFSADLLIINPAPTAREDLVPISDLMNEEFHVNQNALPTQKSSDFVLIDPGVLPPYSITPIKATKSLAESDNQSMPTTQNAPFILENKLIRITINNEGDFISIFDKELDREIIPSGSIANQFQIFEDRPLTYDAWDIDIFYDDKVDYAQPAEVIRWVEYGKLRKTLEIKRTIASTTYTQLISIRHNTKQIDFNTTIDWRERYKLLKVAFPVDILSPKATYEIQWGNVERNTHRNTSWDWARFETCAHKWVDLSEGDYGVSLINDCKYGHDIHNNVIRLSLLRGPTIPDPQADLGVHEFRYSLLLHSGNWDERTQAAAYALNDPAITFRTQNQSKEKLSTESLSLISVDKKSVLVETIKKAEDGNGFILRLYESHRKRGTVEISSHFPIKAAWETNLLEENLSPCELEREKIIVHFNPFEIKTLRVFFK